MAQFVKMDTRKLYLLELEDLTFRNLIPKLMDARNFFADATIQSGEDSKEKIQLSANCYSDAIKLLSDIARKINDFAVPNDNFQSHNGNENEIFGTIFTVTPNQSKESETEADNSSSSNDYELPETEAEAATNLSKDGNPFLILTRIEEMDDVNEVEINAKNDEITPDQSEELEAAKSFLHFESGLNLQSNSFEIENFDEESEAITVVNSQNLMNNAKDQNDPSNPLSSAEVTISLKSKNSVFECKEEGCGKKFPRQAHLNRHMSKHTGERPFDCEHCDRKFTQKEHVNRHMSTHTAKKQFECKDCDQKFKRNDHLKSHENVIHAKKKPFLCDVDNCIKRFAVKQQLDRHKRQSHQAKKFECPECSKEYTNLKIHLALKHPKKNLNCSKCDKQFPDKTKRSFHIRTKHTTIETHKCHWPSCEYETKIIQHLKSHGFKHTGERPFKCNICGNGFSQTSGLKRHQITHSQDKDKLKFECSSCPKKYTHMHQLKEHLIEKHNVTIYKCSICGQTFIDESARLSHEQTMHEDHLITSSC